MILLLLLYKYLKFRYFFLIREQIFTSSLLWRHRRHPNSMENECSKQQSKWRWKMIYTFPYYRRNSITLCRSRIVKVAFLIFITSLIKVSNCFFLSFHAQLIFFLFIAFARAFFFNCWKNNLNTKKNLLDLSAEIE